MKLGRLNLFYRVHAKIYDVTRRFFLLDRERAIEVLEVEPGNLVYDYGCGTGLNVRFLLRKNPKKIVGIDYSDAMLERARQKYSNVEFVHGNIETHMFPEKADRIICTYALSMVENFEEVLEQIKKNLKDDGTLVILDFHRWTNGWSILFPIFEWWLKVHGVNPNLRVAENLKKNFKDVEEKILRCGYNVIVCGRNLSFAFEPKS